MYRLRLAYYQYSIRYYQYNITLSGNYKYMSTEQGESLGRSVVSYGEDTFAVAAVFPYCRGMVYAYNERYGDVINVYNPI